MPLRFYPALAPGTGSCCPAAPAHVLPTARPEPIGPEPGTGALLPGNHLNCPKGITRPCPRSAQRPFSRSPNSPAQGKGRRPACALPWQAVPEHFIPAWQEAG